MSVVVPRGSLVVVHSGRLGVKCNEAISKIVYIRLEALLLPAVAAEPAGRSKASKQVV